MSPTAISSYKTLPTPGKSNTALDLSTGQHVRRACRNGFCSMTSGLAPTFLQANLIILPSRYAADFRGLCARNPVPCPLIAESKTAGSFNTLKSHIEGVEDKRICTGTDLRQDAPRYMVYRDGNLVKDSCKEINDEWTDDHVAFLIGCSFSFESALTEAGLEPRHTAMSRNVPMYRTSIPLCKSGVFDSGTYVVSMRPYKKSDIESVRDITRAYSTTHGEPIAWGWDAIRELGIGDIDEPEWGSPPLLRDSGALGKAYGDEDNIPVFWGCGVTPQEAVMRAGLEGTVMAHTPGHMLVLDCRDSDITEK